MSTTFSTSRDLVVSLPEALAQNLEQMALSENRAVSDLVAAAVRAYQFQLFELKLERLRPPQDPSDHSITQDDIEALVDEIRSEDYARQTTKP